MTTTRPNHWRALAGTSVALAVSLAVAACGGPPSSTSVGGAGADDHVEVAIGYNNTAAWDPLNTGSAFAMAANNHIYEPLWDIDPVTREPYPALAKTMPNDTNATEWTVELREGATWHDGEPVTADDVVYSFERVLAKDPLVITHSFIAPWLEGVTKIDDSTVKIELKFPFRSALDRFPIVKIMPKHVFEGKSSDYLAIADNAVGSGPYEVVESQESSFTSFERHEDYNGPLEASFESMRWNAAVDAASRIGLMMSRGTQIAENVPPETAGVLEDNGLEVEGVDSMNLLGLAFNAGKEPLDDKRVRQALRMAIDTEKLIDLAVAGEGTPASSFLHESSPAYHKASTQYEYNPEKAKKLLAQAGVDDLSVRLMSTDISWTRIAVNTIKESWDAIGVETTLDIKDTAAFDSQVAAGEPADALAFSGNPNQFGADADLNIRWFYSASTPFLPWSGWGQTPEYEALDRQLKTAQREVDPEKHQTLTNEAMDMIADQAVIYPVMHMQLFTTWDEQLDGVRPLDIPGVSLFGVERSD